MDDQGLGTYYSEKNRIKSLVQIPGTRNMSVDFGKNIENNFKIPNDTSTCEKFEIQ